MTPYKLLHVSHLSISYSSQEVVRDLSFSVQEGERVGIVGESGSGKSSAVRAILRLLPFAKLKGEIFFEGKNLLQIEEKELHQIRGREIGMAFQEMGSSLNPTMRVGKQIEEVCATHSLKNRSLELLEQVGLSDDVYQRYPHELSGGMKQRVLLAIAMACHPKLLIADEPTTALDPKTKEQILSLLQQREQIPTLLLVSHDLPFVAKICDRILIFHKGQLVEEGMTSQVLHSPIHPYTKMLLSFL